MRTLFLWITSPFWQFAFVRARTARQATLLWSLAVAVEKRIPLVPFLEALGDEAGGEWRRNLRGLAGLLHSGASIPDALDAIPGILSADTLAMIRVGAESGRLGPALREAAGFCTRRAETSAAPDGSSAHYLCGLALAMLSITGFMMYWIVPKFKAIFEGFDMELPEITKSIVEYADFAANYYPLVVPLVVLLLVAAARLAAQFSNWTGGATGPPRWLTRTLPRLHAPLVLRSLALAVDGARPLGAALEILGARHADLSLRRRVAHVDDLVSQGMDCWQGLQSVGLIRSSEVALLDAAGRAGNLGWALRSLADSIERRAEHRLRVIVELLRPVGLLVAGSAVAFFVIGMFLPTVKLLSDFHVEGAGR